MTLCIETKKLQFKIGKKREMQRRGRLERQRKSERLSVAAEKKKKKKKGKKKRHFLCKVK